MNLGKLVFAQITQHLPLTTFRRYVWRAMVEGTRSRVFPASTIIFAWLLLN